MIASSSAGSPAPARAVAYGSARDSPNALFARVPCRTGRAASDSHDRNRAPTVAASGARAAAHLPPSGSSQPAVSCASASTQPHPNGRSSTPSGPRTNSSSTASATRSRRAPSKVLISRASPASAATRSSRTSIQCACTLDGQSRLP